MAREEQAVSTDAVRAELSRVLASPYFDASECNRGFLAFVVEEALAGRTDRIKAYTIATRVFGRDPKFDPQLDAIVRIEAGRLRRSLDRYYLTGGRGNSLRIDIPRGGYAPVFSDAHPVPVREHRVPSVLVAAFEEEGDQSSFPSFTRGFTRSLIIALTRFTNLRVFGAETAMRRPAEVDPGSLHRKLAIDYTVTGQSSYAANPAQPGGYRIGIFLYHYAHGRFTEALEKARRVNAPRTPCGYVAEAAAAAELGQKDEAAAAVARILSLDPDYGARAVSDLKGRGVAPRLVRALAASLTEAGLGAGNAPATEQVSLARP